VIQKKLAAKENVNRHKLLKMVQNNCNRKW